MTFDGLSEPRLITCILPRGDGPGLVAALREEMGIDTASIATGRGVSERTDYFAEEVSILTVVCAAEAADAIFDFLYQRIDLDHSLGRFMFQARLSAATAFALPHLPEESA